MENNELKKVCIKNCTCYYFDDIIKIKDFDFDDILLDKKSFENILIFDISHKIWLMQKIKYMGLLEFMMELNI